MADGVENLIIWANSRNYRQRTIVPGLVLEAEDGIRERTVEFQTGIADLLGGQAAAPDSTPTAPVLSIVGGGFFCLLPTSAGDEMLGLVSDRATSEWRLTRSPGQADRINGKRSKVLSDILLTPFSITAPAGAPETWDHLVIGGPAGVAIEVNLDGSVVISKSAAPAATITIAATGSITIEVEAGQDVKIGDALAESLVKSTPFKSAMSAAWAAGAAVAPTPMAGNNGSLAFIAAQTAWDSSLAGNPIDTTKAKGT